MLCQAFGAASSSSFVCFPCFHRCLHWLEKKNTTILFWTAIRWPRRRLKEVFLFASIDSWFSLWFFSRVRGRYPSAPRGPIQSVCHHLAEFELKAEPSELQNSWLLLPTAVTSPANAHAKTPSLCLTADTNTFRSQTVYYLFIYFLLHAHSFSSYLFLLTFIPSHHTIGDIPTERHSGLLLVVEWRFLHLDWSVRCFCSRLFSRPLWYFRPFVMLGSPADSFSAAACWYAVFLLFKYYLLCYEYNGY